MFDLPVLVVKASTSGLGFFDEHLSRFSNSRISSSALDALQVLEAHPAHVVITEMDIGEMTGIELAEAIRDIDGETGHFTYVILIGPVPPAHIQEDSFHGVIDTLTGTRRPEVLEHLILAGGRISSEINQLRKSNESMQQLCNELRRGQLLDTLTGLGNQDYARQALADSIRQIESRGGAACLVMISLANHTEIENRYDTAISDELIVAIANRLQKLVRPLDFVTYFSAGMFALILVQPSIEQCTADCYRRIFDGLRLKSYPTRAGHQNVTIGMSICAATAETGAPKQEEMIEIATQNLAESVRSATIMVHHIKLD